MEGKIFISYRRSDAGPYSQLVYAALEKHFGESQVFLDVDNIDPGQNFVDVLESAISQCDVAVVLIGPTWLTVTEEKSGERRIDNPQDFVRLEVASALRRGISVIPVLVNNAVMPGENSLPDEIKLLARQNAFKTSERANRDIEADLVPTIRQILEETERERTLKTRRAANEKLLGMLRAEEDEFGYNLASSQPSIRPHAFVIMPFGKKRGWDGSIYDFNAIYAMLLKPAIETAGFEAFRADEETTSGDILTDMFQELLLADLCIVDMSIDNANVFYELGIRHALRKRGIVHVQAGRAYMPFDIFNVRSIPYHITGEGVPDPAFLEKDKAAIARVVRDTWASDANTIHSPIYSLLDRLAEPDPKSLRTPLATGFWREYDEWKQRVTSARQQKRIGDIRLLTDEIRNPAIKEEAIKETCAMLQDMGYRKQASLQFLQGRELFPKNEIFRREEALWLLELGRIDEAVAKLENMIQENPSDQNTIAALGRVYRDIWLDSWQSVTDPKKRIREAYFSSHWLIKSIDVYISGYNLDQDKWRIGAQALIWMTVVMHLAEVNEETQNPEVQRYQALLPEFRGAVLHAMKKHTVYGTSNFDSQIGEAEVTMATAASPSAVAYEYRKALAYAKDNPRKLASAIRNLETLSSLDFRPEFVQAGLSFLQEAFELRAGQAGATTSGDNNSLVLLFVGHMVDFPDQKDPVFPRDMEPEVLERICAKLDELKADENTQVIQTSAAAGSNIVFVEECLRRQMHIEILLPQEESRYIEDWISPWGADWTARYYRIRNHPNVTIRGHLDMIGLPREGDRLLDRHNKWGLYCAIGTGTENAHLIALWNGTTKPRRPDEHLINDLVQHAHEVGVDVIQINPTKFNYWKKQLTDSQAEP